MKLLPWILVGVGVFLMLLAQESNPTISMIGLVLFLIGGLPGILQLRDYERQNEIREINDRLYALGFTENEVNERQAELKSYSKSKLKNIKHETNMKIEEQEKVDFFEPLNRK